MVREKEDGKAVKSLFISRVRSTLACPEELVYEQEWEKETGRYKPCIDLNIVNLLNKGRIELTDQLFFELLFENPAYLTRAIFQKRIALWQSICRSDSTTQDDKNAARERLHYLGDVLGETKRGPKQQYDEMDLLWAYKDVVEWCTRIWNQLELDNVKSSERWECIKRHIQSHISMLEELLPKTEDYALKYKRSVESLTTRLHTLEVIFVGKKFNNPSLLARAVVQEEWSIRSRTLQDVLSKTRD